MKIELEGTEYDLSPELADRVKELMQAVHDNPDMIPNILCEYALYEATINSIDWSTNPPTFRQVTHH